MLVKYWMSKNVITIDADRPIKDAIKLLEKHDIHILPVVNHGALVGIVTKQDIKRATLAAASTVSRNEMAVAFDDINVQSLMQENVISVQRNLSIEETAEILLENNISGAPVVDMDGELEGVITKSDIFKVLISLTGLKRRGIQFALKLEDRVGSVAEISDTIRKYGGRMACLLTSYERVPEGYRRVYIRMYDIDRFKLESLKDEIKQKADLLYLIDRKESLREIF